MKSQNKTLTNTPENPDNHEVCLKYFEILMERDASEDITEYPLPEGFRFVFYKPGDKKDWIEIEMSAREFVLPEEGEDAWERYYGGKEEELENRMIFIEDSNGEKVATATAFYEPSDAKNVGWLHWVAVKRSYQGRGLSKPLISFTLRQLVRLGYDWMKVPTQTTTWVAAKIYLDFGFRPIPENGVRSREGYQILRTLTHHPSLIEFDFAPYEKIWDTRMTALKKELQEQIPRLEYFCEREWEGEKKILYCAGGVRGKKSSPKIRKAELCNIEELAELALLLWPEHTVQDLKEEFSEIILKNEAQFFLKYEQDIPVGFAQCQLRHDYVEGTETSPVGYLEGIFVKEDFRHKGYAKELLEACEKWAKLQGCREFASDCEIKNETSFHFHMAMKFEEANRIICFTKKL